MLRPERFLALLWLVGISHASAAPLFEDAAVLDIELVGPLSSLLEDTEASRELPFVLRAEGIEHSIKVEVRGKSRKRVCDFPPLRLNFVVGNTANSVFDGQDKLKLVTHCQRRESAQLNTLEEYAAYQVFNIISDISYRVRLLRITYNDTDGGPIDATFERYGFLIESASELSDRIDAQIAQIAGVSLGSLDEQQAAAVFVFQYLIGNTDWSLVKADGDDSCCHNGDLFDIGAVRYVVPYDFDLSGLVNTRYARPDPSLRISRVTQRLYRGYCISSDALRDALGKVNFRKDDILNVVNRLPLLSQNNIEATRKYLDQFFARANNEDRLMQQFERNCL